MKSLYKSLICLGLFACTGSANATFFYYFGADTPSDSGVANTTVSTGAAQAAWEQKVTDLGYTIGVFNTNASTINAATSGLTDENGDPVTLSSSSTNINLSNPSNVNRGTSDGYELRDPTDPTGLGNTTFANCLADPVGNGCGVDPSTRNVTNAVFDNTLPSGVPDFQIEVGEEDISNDFISGQRRSGVFFNDAPTGKTAETITGWKDVLSIGKFNGFDGVNDPLNRPATEFDNDDFNLELTDGSQLYAFAFNIINNRDPGVGVEELEVFSASGGTQITTIGGDDHDNTAVSGTASSSTTIPGYTGGNGAKNIPGIGDVDFIHTSFVGIVTDNPSEVFSFLRFNEDGGVNDIGIFNLRFAVVPVPVPAAVWLFGSALIALFGLRRKRIV